MSPRYRLRIRNAILEDRVVALTTDAVVLGRGEQADVFLDDGSISRLHARLVPRRDGVLVADLESRNGTYVNGEKLRAPVLATPGAEIRFGSLPCTLEWDVAASGGAPSKVRQILDARQALRWIAALSVLAAFAAVAVLLQETLALQPEADKELPEPPAVVRATAEAPAEAPAENPPDAVAPPPATDAESGTASAHPSESEVGSREAPSADEPVVNEPALEPPAAHVLLKDNTVLLGFVMADGDPECVWLRPEQGGEPVQVDALAIESIDGKPWTADVPRIAALRFERARNPSSLRAHMSWCREWKLADDERKTAERILALEPTAADALAVLGRCSVRGVAMSVEAARAQGVLDAFDRLIGPAKDAQRITAWYFDLLGRPPLAEELHQALSGPDAALLDALLSSDEHARHTLGEYFPLLRTAAVDVKSVAMFAAGNLSLTEALHAAALEVANSSARVEARAAAILGGLLAGSQSNDRNLIDAASRMLAGERTALFGERGSNASELIAILCKQPGFFRKVLEVESSRCLGARADAEFVKRAIFRVAADPSALAAMRREWLVGEVRAGADPRWMNAEQRCAAAIAWGCRRVPAPGEVNQLLADSRALAGKESEALPLLLIDFPAPENAAAYEALVQRVLQRPANAEEKALFNSTPVEARGALVAALFTNPAWGRYGP
jgi:hypothetical protein